MVSGSLHGGADDDDRALGAGDRAVDEQNALVNVDAADLEVLDGGCQGVRPRMVGIGFTLLLLTAGLTDNGTLPLWGTVLAGMVGLALVLGGVRDA